MKVLLLMLLAALSATVIPVQASVNGRLGQLVGNPLLAALISFLGGTIALGLILLVSTPGWPSLPEETTWGDIPIGLLTGGLLGAVFVTTVLTLVPKIGPANVLSAAIFGQLVMSVIVDHNGWFGMPISRVSLMKIGGCLLMVIGVLMIQHKPGQ